MNKLYVFGHTKPDTDSIASAIVFAKLQKALGIDAVAYKLGEVNKETKYALKTFEVEEPQTLTSVDENCDVALVDNNEFSQSVSGIEKAHVKMVVDHHKIKMETVEPIYFITEPLGCTCTILYKLYKQNEVDIDSQTAGLMLRRAEAQPILLSTQKTLIRSEYALRAPWLFQACFLLFRLRINRLHALAKQHGHGFGVTFAVIFLNKADRAAALVRGMVKPLAAAHRDAVVAGKPFFTSGLDELFALSEKKFFEVNGRGAFLLLWRKFYVLCQNVTSYICISNCIVGVESARFTIP